MVRWFETGVWMGAPDVAAGRRTARQGWRKRQRARNAAQRVRTSLGHVKSEGLRSG